MPRHIVRGQPIDSAKKDMARRLRLDTIHVRQRLLSYVRAYRFEGRQFRRQQITNGYIADFYGHSAALVIEIDGEIQKAQRAYDAERQATLEFQGRRDLRFTNDQVMSDLENVLSHISATGTEHRH